MNGIEIIESKLAKAFNKTECNLLKWVMIQKCYELHFDELAKKFEKSLESELTVQHHEIFLN